MLPFVSRSTLVPIEGENAWNCRATGGGDANLNIRMSSEMRTQLAREAQRTESSASQVARQLVKEGLNRRQVGSTEEART